MKIKLYLFSALLAALPLLSSGCSNRNVSVENTDFESLNGYIDSDKGIIKRTLLLKNFHGIDANGVVEVYYTQGSKYKVEYEGRRGDFNKLKFYVKDGTLFVKDTSKKRTYSYNDEKCKLYITAPSITELTNLGSFVFYADKMNTSRMTIDNTGSMSIKVNSLKTGAYKMSSRGSISIAGKYNVESFDMDNSGACSCDVSLNVSGDVNVDNSGASKYNGSIVARNVNWNGRGADNCMANIKANTIEFIESGAGKVSGKFKGDNISVSCSGASKMDIDVNCNSVKANASGNGNITLSGMADHADVGTSGIAKIDTSRLNDF